MRQGRSVLGSLLLATLVASAGLPASAQKTTFEPSIELGQGHTDNVRFAATDTRSDDVTTVRLVLPWLREWRTGRLHLRYEPAVSRYADTKALDRDEHRLRFVIGAEPKRGTRYNLATRYRLAQVQGNTDVTDPESPDSEDFFAPTERQIGSADFTLAQQLGPRWVWDMGLGGSRYEYKLIDGIATSQTVNAVEDRSEVRSSVGFSRRLRSAGSVGFQFAYSEFDLELSPDADTSSVRLVFKRRTGRNTEVAFAVGAYELDSEQAGQDRSGVDFDASIARRFRKVVLRLSGRSAPSSGGAQPGSSTNSQVGLSLSNLQPAKWGWRFSPRIAERDANAPSGGTRRTIAIGGEVGRRVAKQLRIRLRANHIAQTDDSPGVEDRENLTAEFALQWFPRGGA